MPRQKVRNRVDEGAVRPVAAPTDPFVQSYVTPPEPSALDELSRALALVNPKLQSFLNGEQERLGAEAEAEGERLAQENADEDFSKLVKAGKLAPGFHPGVRRGFERSKLRNKSYGYGQALREAYAASAISESDDPNVFAQFRDEFTANWMKDNLSDFSNERVEDTALPIIEREQSVLAQRHVENRAKAVEDGLREELSMELLVHLDRKLEAGDDIDTADLGAFISEVGRQYVSRGVSGSDLNYLVVDTVAAKAIEEGDDQILDLLDHIQTGTGKLSDTQYARQKREQAENSITGAKIREEKRVAWQAEEARKDIVKRYSKVFLRAMIEGDPFTDTDEYVSQVAAVDPDAAQQMLKLQDMMQKREFAVVEDPVRVSEIWDSLYSIEDPADRRIAIMTAATNGHIDERSVSELMRMSERLDEDASPLRSRSFMDTERYIQRLIQGGDEVMEGSTKIFLARQATLDARDTALAWLEVNRDRETGAYNRLEWRQFLRKLERDIATDPRYGVAGEISGGLSDLPQSPSSATVSPSRAPHTNTPAPFNVLGPHQGTTTSNPFADPSLHRKQSAP